MEGAGCSSAGALAFTSSIQDGRPTPHGGRCPSGAALPGQLVHGVVFPESCGCLCASQSQKRVRAASGPALCCLLLPTTVSERLVGKCLTPGQTPSSCCSPWRRKCGKGAPLPSQKGGSSADPTLPFSMQLAPPFPPFCLWMRPPRQRGQVTSQVLRLVSGGRRTELQVPSPRAGFPPDSRRASSCPVPLPL